MGEKGFIPSFTAALYIRHHFNSVVVKAFRILEGFWNTAQSVTMCLACCPKFIETKTNLIVEFLILFSIYLQDIDVEKFIFNMSCLLFFPKFCFPKLLELLLIWFVV